MDKNAFSITQSVLRSEGHSQYVCVVCFFHQLEQQQLQSFSGNYSDAFHQILRIMSGKVALVIFPKAAIVSISWYWLCANRDIKRFAPGEGNEMLQDTKAAEHTES